MEGSVVQHGDNQVETKKWRTHNNNKTKKQTKRQPTTHTHTESQIIKRKGFGGCTRTHRNKNGQITTRRE